MLFQIDYRSNGLYDKYFEHNKDIIDQIDYELFDDVKVDDFLKEYGYYDMWYGKQVEEKYKYAEMPIKCAMLRLMLLYELGGMYLDADTWFHEPMVGLETHMNERFANRNVVLSNGSLYFVKALKRSDYIKSTLDLYINAPVLKSDVDMTKKDRRLSKFHKELMIIPTSYLDSYLTVDYTHTIPPPWYE